MSQPALAEVVTRLQALGLRKRAGAVFTLELAEDVLGWLGLNTASKHRPAGEREVNPIVGIRHQRIERVVAELRGQGFHAYLPPTVSTPLGYLMPGASYRAWVLGASDATDEGEDLIAAVESYALTFMGSSSSLPRLCELLDEGLGFEHQLTYRRPVAWQLAGDAERSLRLIEESEADLGNRDDAAAVELRAYFAAFRDRFAVKPSG